jgi:hypothetical protein
LDMHTGFPSWTWNIRVAPPISGMWALIDMQSTYLVLHLQGGVSFINWMQCISSYVARSNNPNTKFSLSFNMWFTEIMHVLQSVNYDFQSSCQLVHFEGSINICVLCLLDLRFFGCMYISWFVIGILSLKKREGYWYWLINQATFRNKKIISPSKAKKQIL